MQTLKSFSKSVCAVSKCVNDRNFVNTRFTSTKRFNMVNNKIPDRWEKYAPIGEHVMGTKLLPFKVPLKTQLVSNKIPPDEWFTPEILMEKTPSLKAVIDLTATDRYYNPMEFTTRGVRHKKISIRGGGEVPTDRQCLEFFRTVDAFLEDFDGDEDALIGVHCTHGLNRTGYLICKYMVARMKIDPNEAIRRFQDARGYHMERIEYVRNIRIPLEKRETRTSSSSASSTLTSRKREQKVENWRAEPRRVPHERNEANSVAYRSPLKGYYHEEDHSRSEGRYGRRRYPPGPRS